MTATRWDPCQRPVNQTAVNVSVMGTTAAVIAGHAQTATMLTRNVNVRRSVERIFIYDDNLKGEFITKAS